MLEVRALRKTYAVGRRMPGRRGERFVAVDDVSFDLAAAETLAVVGESGAGKSTLGRMVLRLIEPDSGEIRLLGKDLRTLRRGELRRMRPQMQMIFQDPYSSLDPKINILDAVIEPIRLHSTASRAEREEQAGDLLRRVGIRRDQWDRYPYELSGGQLQRVAIARAIITSPQLVVCDEPVAALDVSMRAEVLNLLRELQVERGIAYLFITHDLSLVRSLADRVAVMRAGRIVEIGAADQVVSDPQEEYTRQLVDAIPQLDPTRRRLVRPAAREVAGSGLTGTTRRD